MDWLTDNKIPIGKWASNFFDWLRDNFSGVFDAMADGAEALIEGLLWLLQTPHPLIIIGLFVGLTWILQRNWKTCLLVALGFGIYTLVGGYRAVVWTDSLQAVVLFAGFLLGRKTIWVDSIANSRKVSLSCRAACLFATRVLTQWPELETRRVRYLGRLL